MGGNRNHGLKAIAFVVASLGTGAAKAEWTLVDLGALGGRNSYASAVSDSGIVAGCAETADGRIHAFVYQAGAMRDLGAGSDVAGDSCALAVNDQGVVAGRASTGELVIWTDGGVTNLGIKGNVGGMNASGVVVGARTAGESTRAFVYREGVVSELGDASTRSEATAINARGQITGNANGHAFLYDGSMRDLGTLGGNHSNARGINARGEVVGGSSNALGAPTPFIYGGGMQALAAPAYSAAIAINTSGQIVGSGEGIHGYSIEGSTMTPLGMLPDVVAKGWRHLEPTAINDRGWIVGTAENAEGDLRAFVLMPGTRGKPYRPASM